MSPGRRASRSDRRPYATRRRTAWRAAVAIAAITVLTPAGMAIAAPLIDDARVAGRQYVGVMTLDQLYGTTATRSGTGAVEVGWDIPGPRWDLELGYSVSRTVDGVSTEITPTISGTPWRSGFADDLAIPATVAAQPSTAISAGEYASCAIAGGDAYCWGKGWLGDGTHYPGGRTSPVRVAGLAGVQVRDLAVGNRHMCVASDDAVYCWGDGPSGQLGLGPGTTGPVGSAAAVPGLSGPVTSIAAGREFTCAAVGGSARCWGYGGDGQLGNGSTSSADVPTPVLGLDGVPIVEVAAGTTHACARSADGAVYCWGQGDTGQLGLDDAGEDRFEATHVPGLSGVTAIAAGNEHTCAVANGLAYCWGWGSPGVIGDGTTSTRRTPTLVSGLTGVTAISAGMQHTCAVAAGTPWCWGSGLDGRLGTGDESRRLTPTAVSLAGTTEIAAADDQTCAIAGERPHCWGRNLHGELGYETGFMVPSLLPKPVTATLFTSLVCDSDWLLAGDRCIPGPDVAVSYDVVWTARGWWSRNTEIVPTWTA